MRTVIVGGGLAGAITGLHLQQRGVETRILERKPGPGTTPCGEGLSARTLRLLEPVFDARPFVDTTFHGARWRFPGMAVLVHRRCHTMAREDWIPAMLDTFEARGGTVEYGAGSDGTGLLVAEGGDADVVVGADGPGSRVRRRVPGAAVRLRTGIQVRLETDRKRPWLEFVTSKRFSREYAWWFPRRDAHNVGLLADQDGHDEARLDAFLEHLGLNGRIRAREAFPIAFSGTRLASPDGSRLLIGDAGGLTNPVTKGGIAAVVRAAPLLADAVARGRPGDYARRMRRHPLTHASYGRALQRLRSWSDADMERLLAPAPATFHIGRGGGRIAAARAALRRPRHLLALRDLYQATARSLDHSW